MQFKNDRAMEIRPLQLAADDLTGWDRTTWQHAAARFWGKYAPRGKGWGPRLIGKAFCRNLRDTILLNSGAKLAIDFRSLDIYCAMERLDGVWDSHVAETCYRLLKPESVFYDIGANVGSISIEMAKRLDDAIHVYSFEPQPDLAKCLAVSAALNGFKNVNVFATMLGESEGNADLYVPAHSIHASAVFQTPGSEVMSCSVATLDQLVDSGILRGPDVIKIDVEGAELDVFRGAQKTIARYRPHIVFECYIKDQHDKSRNELCGYLNELCPYQFSSIDGAAELRSSDALMTDVTVHDMLAAPRNK